MPKPSGLRIVWLEAFVAVADGGTQEAAAEELEVDQTTVSRYIGALETWLHKVLMDPTVPGQLWPDGQEFILTAIEVLLLLKGARGPKWDNFGQLRIEWLEALVSRAKNPKQIAAAAQLGVEQPDISRHLTSLSEWLGEPLVDRKGRRVLLPAGERFLPTAQKVLTLLDEAKASFPPQQGNGPAPAKIIRVPR